MSSNLLIKKVLYLLSPAQKRQLFILAGLMVIGMLFEMLGLGMLIPVLGFMLNPNLINEYPVLQSFLKILGNPSHTQLILWGMNFLVLLYFMKAIFLIFLNWRQSKFSLNLSTDISKVLFMGYLQQPYVFHLKKNSAVLLRNLTEIGTFSSVTKSTIEASIELSLVLGTVLTLVLVDPFGSSIIIMFLIVFGTLFHFLTKKKVLDLGRIRQHYASFVNQHLLQGLGAVKEIKFAGKEEYFLKQYSKPIEEITKAQVKMSTLIALPRMYMEFLAVAGLAILVILTIMQNKPIGLLLPTLAIFIAGAFRLLPSVNRIMLTVQNMRFAKPVIDLLYSELKLVKANEYSLRADTSKFKFTNEILVNKVSFNYENVRSKALNEVSIKIQKGESVGLIGASGSGKSTLIDLILGLLTPVSGWISVDNLNIQETMRGWQNQIGYIPQFIYLTDDTLKNNIAFGIAKDDINNDNINRAIKAAQLEGFVETLPEGLETSVGERGVRLSGGQRQRIGIARALYHNPSVLILDEATSALDSVTENDVMQAIYELKGDLTLIIVAHRLSTVERCNKIYKLQHGKLIDCKSPNVKVLPISSN
jgi:ABC-type multidrug transport system fused ATPase/permease subunit